MMAAAEARVAWQRTANRYFVQEDAKRAPKLACYPPPSSSEPRVDGELDDTSGDQEHSSAGFVPHNWNPSNYSMPTETKWWLHLQPNIGHQRDFSSEQLNVFEMELENLRNEEIKKMSNLSEDPRPPSSAEQDLLISTEKKGRETLDMHHKDSEHCMENLTVAQDLMAADGGAVQKTFLRKSIREDGHKGEELDANPCDCLISKQSDNLFNIESSWMGDGKTEPWWRTADKDELASLVAQKSLDLVENCDLPPPQAMHVRKSPFASLENFGNDGMFSSIDKKETSGLCCAVDRSWGCLTNASVDGRQHGHCEKGISYGSDKSFRSITNQATCNKDLTDANESEQSKAQLMEALRHSQTRAREAEQAAQQAYNEKEHIIQLFFKQASQLFAYKQWLQLLQLESLYHQLKNKDQPISTLFPTFLPWMPHKTKKGKHKTKKTKRSQSGCDIGRYAVAFAVGLGLAGAGLLLGWTMGWLFPMF